MATDIALSEDGKFFYLCRPAPGDGLTSFILDKWQLLPDGPKLIGQTSAPINEEQNSAWETLNEGDTVPLIPARDPSAHSKPAAFLENGNYLRTGNQFMENPLLKQGPLPEHIAGGLLTEFWEEASRQGNYVAVTRRMRLQAPLKPEQEEARQKHLRDQVQKIYKKLNWYPDLYHDWYPERKAMEQRKILGEHTDFDDLPEDVGPPASEEHDDLEAMSNASSNESDGHTEETESIDSFSSDHGDEDESPEDDIRSLSDSESVESGGSRWTSSSIASVASSVRSTESLKRMHTRDMMESSTNDAYFSELIRSHEYKKCDGCGFSAYRWLHCFECHASDLDLCTTCSAEGGWCLDKSHPLLEADHNGPITMRRFSNWTLGHQLRIWDTSKDEDFIFQVQYFSDERILHSSQPVLHPTAPVVAWALSPTKIVLAYFGEDEDEVSQRMRPFSEGGRRISVDLKFSPCGSYLLVASVEAYCYDPLDLTPPEPAATAGHR